jgi:hypothetical protein
MVNAAGGGMFLYTYVYHGTLHHVLEYCNIAILELLEYSPVRATTVLLIRQSG